MTISAAEDLKRQLTDKFVVVQDGVAELRRFQGLTGTVKTVNMSGRALVQFDGPVDIGWYDIDTNYLRVVDQPSPKKIAAHGDKEHAKAPATKPAAEKPTVKAGGSPLDQIRKQGAAAPATSGEKKSPLDMIRQQGGAKPGATPAADGGAKASPLDAIRKQGAAKATDADAAPAAPQTPPATPAKPPAGMSPLDMIRQQGAAKR